MKRRGKIIALAVIAALTIALAGAWWNLTSPAAKSQALVRELRRWHSPPSPYEIFFIRIGMGDPDDLNKNSRGKKADDLEPQFIALGPYAIPPLLEALQDNNDSVRYDAFIFLTKIDPLDPRVTSAAYDIIQKDTLSSLRFRAAETLIKSMPDHPPPKAIEVVCETLENNTGYLRLYAADLLLKMIPDKATRRVKKAFTKALHDDSPRESYFVNEYAVLALLEIDPNIVKTEGLPALASILPQRFRYIKAVPSYNSFIPRIQADPELIKNTLKKHIDITELALPHIVGFLKNRPMGIIKWNYHNFTEIFVFIGPASKPYLMDLLQDDESLHIYAALALARIDREKTDQKIISIILEALKALDISMFFNTYIVNALRQTGATAVPFLLEMLEDQDETSKRYAAIILAGIDKDIAADKILPMLMQIIKEEPGWTIYNSAISLLPQYGPAAYPAIGDLIRILESSEDNFYKILAAESLGRFGPAAHQAVPVLKRLQNEQDERTRNAAYAALQKIEK
ncbi:HEAT repeat domain-containing protein [Planctomycetota bacterium]